MKSSVQSTSPMRAFTLVEMSMVLMILLALISTGLFASKKMNDWKLGRQASEDLRTVYAAQRMFLADNPTVAVSSITAAQLIPYLPNQATAMPIIKSLTGAALVIVVNDPDPDVHPYLKDGAGVRYDPSASPPNYKDALWDVGE
jgi:prepilin-type N-terminal cleavage/methylation domain-containing protein